MMRLSYANLMATGAMFVALGGTSYAAVKLKKDSVTSREVKDASLQAADLAPGVIGSGPAGARGPRGVDGPIGAKGDTGATGPARIIVRKRDGDAVVGFGAGNSVNVATLKLPAGTWWLEGDTEGMNFPNQSPSQDSFYCGLVVDGVMGPAKEAFLGNIAGASHFASFTMRQRVTAPATVVLRCGHHGAIPAGASTPVFRKTTLTATEPGSLDVEDVTG